MVADPDARLAAILDASHRIDTGERARSVIHDRLPWLESQLLDDAASGRFAIWGRSSVIDEHVGAAVVDRDVFEELHRLAGVEAQWPIGNAGVLHVYGYLFSETATPYGAKRDRWLDGGLGRALGRTPDLFLPWGGPEAHGTVLQRVTDLAGSVLADPRRPGSAVVLVIDDAVPIGAAPDAGLMRTLVCRWSSGADTAIVYGRLDADGAVHLVTLFPWKDASEQDLTALAAEPPRLRYNAVLTQLEAGAALGARTVERLS